VSVKEGDGLTLRWGNKEEMMTFHFRSSGGGSKGRHFVAARRCSLKVVAVLVTDGGR
jgi:hypothetical protein